MVDVLDTTAVLSCSSRSGRLRIRDHLVVDERADFSRSATHAAAVACFPFPSNLTAQMCLRFCLFAAFEAQVFHVASILRYRYCNYTSLLSLLAQLSPRLDVLSPS